MEPWAVLQFAFVLSVAIGAFALILGELHVIERAEEQELWKEAREKIAAIR